MSLLSAIPPKPGLFIVFEGIDRAGKTTQAKLLVANLQADLASWQLSSIRFPDDRFASGKLLRQYLTSESQMPARTAHLLFSANRWEAALRIQDYVLSGMTLVCDRYAYSGVAYSVAKGVPFDWCTASDRGLPVPDVVFYFSLPVQSATARADFGVGDRHETAELQERVKQVYEEKLINRGTTWDTINATLPQDEIAEMIYKEVSTLRRSYVRSAALTGVGLFEE